MQREQFGSRLGFILISAGCAIGLGNVWRFPYICGEYGGAAFVLMYLVFLVILGLPIMAMEFAVGRGSQKSIARAFDVLEPKGSGWHRFKWVGIAGNYLLMMFYTTVAGWMLAYVPKMAAGTFTGADTAQTAAAFDAMLGNPEELVVWMIVAVGIAIGVCSLGLQKGVERITKVMMVCLLAIIGVLIVRAVTLPGAGEGVLFYLAPDFSKIFADVGTFCDAAYAAMGQAFFTLSIGMGSMAIFGSYIGKDRSLMGEAATIGALDTGVALATGLIIFPACFAFGVAPDSGPGLVFITLPSVFEQMWLGHVWGTLFFIFMSFAALSTVIAVFECILSFAMDQWGWTRRKAVIFNLIAIPLLSLPCALGFNVLSGVELAGVGNIQSIEDFLVSNNILPLGSLVFVAFCAGKRGWGWDNFLAEANSGSGLKFPAWIRPWMRFGVPTLVIVILALGWLPIIQTWIGMA
ncbi:sodium-dependent transporter [Adlercreutzia faecimuris]|uniref:Transporter n=1 Tax=Adlercreutzia faecimuris TaxID=2897341 RepID=A0ABS9WI77_9ACTN|nr:sodium-dependent transporter [Adlercreutzia sp. JBNU-10]MCI2242588.1 sodium-dependent transporter [Adlercreutzia sp. JBNU-10]